MIDIVKDDAHRIGSVVHKLGTHEIIDELQNNLKDSQINPDIYRQMKKGTKEEILDLSLKYQVLSSQTAFICKIQDNVLKQGETAEKVIIPSLISVDMQSRQARMRMRHP